MEDTTPPSDSTPEPPPAPVTRGPDRRKRPTPRFSRYTFFGGRRRGARREGEEQDSFVDRYPGWMVLVILWITFMNLGDSFFTLTHLQSGGIEINPIAAALMQTGQVGFVAWKAVMIALALVVLTLHKNFSLAKGGLWLAGVGYTILNVYHLSLF